MIDRPGLPVSCFEIQVRIARSQRLARSLVLKIKIKCLHPIGAGGSMAVKILGSGCLGNVGTEIVNQLLAAEHGVRAATNLQHPARYAPSDGSREGGWCTSGRFPLIDRDREGQIRAALQS